MDADDRPPITLLGYAAMRRLAWQARMLALWRRWGLQAVMVVLAASAGAAGAPAVAAGLVALPVGPAFAVADLEGWRRLLASLLLAAGYAGLALAALRMVLPGVLPAETLAHERHWPVADRERRQADRLVAALWLLPWWAVQVAGAAVHVWARPAGWRSAWALAVLVAGSGLTVLGGGWIQQRRRNGPLGSGRLGDTPGLRRLIPRGWARRQPAPWPVMRRRGWPRALGWDALVGSPGRRLRMGLMVTASASLLGVLLAVFSLAPVGPALWCSGWIALAGSVRLNSLVQADGLALRQAAQGWPVPRRRLERVMESTVWWPWVLPALLLWGTSAAAEAGAAFVQGGWRPVVVAALAGAVGLGVALEAHAPATAEVLVLRRLLLFALTAALAMEATQG